MRWSAYGKLDSRVVEDGDNAFTGVDMTRDRALLQPGTLARAENKRLRIGAAATRLGNVQAPDFNVPFVNVFIGSGIYSNPNGDEVMLVAEKDQTYVWALQYGKDAFKVNLAGGQTLAGFAGVEFVQAFDKVLLLRRPSLSSTPLQWDGTVGNTFDPIVQPPGSFAIVPAYWNGEPFQSRVLYYNAQFPPPPSSYQFIMSDILQYAGYDPALGTFNVNAGESDWITRIWPYFQQSVVVFKKRSIHQAMNFTIDPTQMFERQLSKRIGLCATKCVIEWGRDVAFLSEPGGIYKLNEVIQDQVASEPLPVSERIQSVIDRINWGPASIYACAAALGEYGYFAVPLDQQRGGNNAVLVLNLINGEWESVPDRWSDPTFLIRALHVTQYEEGRALFGLDYINKKIYALYRQEGFDEMNDQRLPISDLMETRGYTCGDNRAFKRYSRAVAALRTSDPLISVSAIGDGVNEVKNLTPDFLTKDRLKFYPHGHDDFDPLAGDALEPKREDYSLAGQLDDFVGEDYELIPVGPVSMIPPSAQAVIGPRQETREPFSVRVNARWVSLRIENLSGVCDVLATGIEATASAMEMRRRHDNSRFFYCRGSRAGCAGDTPATTEEPMITDETLIKPLALGRTAIQEAVACYRDWLPEVSFEQDVAHYLSEGLVLSTPRCFALAKVIEGPRTGKPAWFIRMAVGRLDELLATLPYAFEEICLCRGKKGDLRVRSYSLARMKQLAGGK